MMKKKLKLLTAILSLGICFSNILMVHAAQVTHTEDAVNRSYLPIESNEIENWPDGPTVYAQGAIVMELSTGAILYEKNVHEKLYPASITKIMTTMLALEHSNLNDIVTFSHNSVFDISYDSSKIGGMDEGDQLTMEQCLYGIMLPSGNDAAYAVAEHVGGDLEGFVQMMNDKAAALGCKNTHFTNPHGLNDEQHYTSAYDMALIAKEAFKSETFRTIIGTARYEFPPNKKGEQRIRDNHHKMLPGGKYAYEGCLGGKTGYTDDSGQTLVTYAQKDGMTLICVVLKEDSPSQFYDTATLFDYGFQNFQKINVADNEKDFSISNANFFQTNSSIFGDTKPLIEMNPNGNIIIPRTAAFSDATPTLAFDNTSDQIVATLSYTYNNHFVGFTTLDLANTSAHTFEFGSSEMQEEKTEKAEEKKVITINLKVILFIIIGIILAIGLFLFIRSVLRNYHFSRKRRNIMRRRRNRRKYSSDFDKYDF